jgi:Na+/H+ antiporter NhaD/arsenite permease-like protein
MIGPILIMVMIGTLALQTFFPKKKMVIILSGATISVFLGIVVGHQTMKEIYNGVPWDVLAIIIGIGVFSNLFALSRVFSVIAVWCSRLSKGSHLLLLSIFALIMFFLSGVLNNLTALLLIFPILISTLRNLGTTQRYIGIMFSLILVSCNLGGASTPIGDFPAILLMGTGSISFVNYLGLAYPVTLLIFISLLILSMIFYRKKARIQIGKVESSFALLTMEKLYRKVTIDKSILLPGMLIFSFMFLLWLAGDKLGLSPDVVCFFGLIVFLIIKHNEGEKILRQNVDFESIIYFACLFIMVSCLAGSGILKTIALYLSNYFNSSWSVIISLMLLTGFSTAIFSAGPSMATMLPIAHMIISQKNLPGEIIYIGLALSVCAGSSFLLTAATSGPLAQSFIEKSNLKTFDNQDVTFNSRTFLPYGLFSFVIIQVSALIFVFSYL